ncbi:MAG TPA: 2-oxo-4-hydroxy-4-carboxy-5-ureidoimidazoline decarboxylase [Propionibacteriaceae bacterium]|nr:2-oxo-4-hydroxy-4-carboxy-5-ureidoimidazoline decarboxylase [Propionibacteriaceae bacterium]
MTGATFEISERELREGLPVCLNVPRWVDEVVGAGPYASLDDLVDAAGLAATPLTADEVDQALADHPRIGERPAGSGASSSLSADEQAASASDDSELAARLAEGNRAYEERFGRIFLIRAADRSRPEILAELERRLLLPPEEEVKVVASELRDIALRRLRQVFGRPDQG